MVMNADVKSGIDPGAHQAADWQGAYQKYRKLLFGALARLAAGGLPLPPDEGLDLVHDFFLEAWDDVVRRYDPDKARFDTYVFGSFLRFARPRIIRLGRTRAWLVSPEEMAEIAGEVPLVEPPGTDQGDLKAVADALELLPADGRRLLSEYVGDAIETERELAARFSLTRYELRMRLADAVGTTAANLGALGELREPDRSIAVSLWRDNRSVREAAGALHLTIPEVQAARGRMFKRLVHAVKGIRKMSVSQSPAVGGKSGGTPRYLLEAALRPEADEKDVDALREHADEIWRLLESAEAEPLFTQYSDLAADRLARIYLALAVDPSAYLEQTVELDQYLQAREDDERSVGEAFSQVLVPNLPKRLASFHDVFSGALQVNDRDFGLLMEEASVHAGGRHAVELARFGLTPVTLAEASRALSNLAMTHCEDNGVEPQGTIIMELAAGGPGSSPSTLKWEALVQEIEFGTDLSRVTSERVLEWLGEVAGFVPQLFDGFDARAIGKELHLLRTDAAEADLFRRWNPHSSEAIAA